MTNESSVFVSHIISEVATVLGIKKRHATSKHAQSLGVLEGNRTFVNFLSRTQDFQVRLSTSMAWHEFLTLAVLKHKRIMGSFGECNTNMVSWIANLA